MSNNYVKSFIKKDFNVSILGLFVILSALSGGTIIFSLLQMDGNFRVDNIYAMYAYLSRLFVMFFPVLVWGSEFRNGTINLIRISGKCVEGIYASKYLTYLFSIVILMIVSFAEVVCYGKITDVSVNSMQLLGNMSIAYFIYGLFFFGLGSVITVLCKDTTKSMITLFLVEFCGSLVCSILGQVNDGVRAILEFCPFSYAESAFSFANFSVGQIANISIIAVVLNIVAIVLLKRRGVV